MHGKVALEEHFAIPETLMDSAGFVPGDYWIELKARLLDMQDRRLREMDAHGIEMMLPSLNAPAVQAIPDRAQQSAELECFGIVRIQVQCTPQMPVRGRKVEPVKELHHGHGVMCVRRHLVESEGGLRGILGLRIGFARRHRKERSKRNHASAFNA